MRNPDDAESSKADMRAPCPSCGAIHNVEAADVGRRFPCYECRVPLRADSAGVRLAAPTAAASAEEIPVAYASEDLFYPPGRIFVMGIVSTILFTSVSSWSSCSSSCRLPTS